MTVSPADAASGATVTAASGGVTVKEKTLESVRAGKCQFFLQPGLYTFTAVKEGYTCAPVTQYIAGILPDNHIDLHLNNNSATQVNRGSAKITVLDASTHQPLSGAHISYTQGGRSETLISDGNGLAAFSLLPGEYAFTVIAPKYKDNAVTLQVSSERTTSGTIEMTKVN